MQKKKIIVAISGASGAIYAIRLIRFLLRENYAVDVVISDYGRFMLAQELDLNIRQESIPAYCRRVYGDAELPGTLTRHDNDNLASPLASGNPQISGMVVVPATMKTMAAIAAGHSAKLIERAADCVLKERQKLIVVPRETPFNLIHIRNMEQITLAGGVILPAMPAFYQKPETIVDLGDFLAARILNVLGIDNNLYRRWRDKSNPEATFAD
jgi:4-hydroxy-3-polyprenylbenzoate decarboxylase